MPTQAISNILGPNGVQLGAAAPGGGSSSDGPGRIVLGPKMKPMKETWPAPDPDNGPLTADSGLVLGAPSTTGMTLYPWNSGVFNTQSQNWVTMPVGTWQNNSGFSACANASTPRWTTWDVNEGLPQESNLDTGFITDSTTVTIVYMHYVHYETRQYHDLQVYADHDGVMKKITNLPKTGSSANGLTYRTLTFKEAREREFRLLLPWNCHFIGIYIGNPHAVRKSPNKLLFAGNGDSWGEPSGNVLATPIGGAWPTGTYQNFGMWQAFIEATSAAVILLNEGGTGYFNVGGTARSEEYFASLGGGNTFMSKLRMEDFAAKYGDRYPILATVGGWNDGTLVTGDVRANYAARVTSGMNRAVDAFEAVNGRDDLQMLFAGIQPVSITPGDARDLSNEGIRDACASADPDNVIGFINLMDMWPNTGMGGQRGNNVNSSDTIHLHAKGAEMVANWLLADIQNMSIPADYYQGMLTAA